MGAFASNSIKMRADLKLFFRNSEKSCLIKEPRWFPMASKTSFAWNSTGKLGSSIQRGTLEKSWSEIFSPNSQALIPMKKPPMVQGIAERSMERKVSVDGLKSAGGWRRIDGREEGEAAYRKKKRYGSFEKGVIPPPIRPDERSTELHPYSPGLCTSLSPGGWPPILDLPISKRIPGSIWFSIKVKESEEGRGGWVDVEVIGVELGCIGRGLVGVEEVGLLRFTQTLTPTYPEVWLNQQSFFLKLGQTLHKLSNQELAWMMLSPRLVGDPYTTIFEWMTNQSKPLQPAHLPMLSDLVDMHRGLYTFLRWWLEERKEGKKGLLVPEELEFLLDPTPTFPQMREYATLTSNPLILEMKGYSNALLPLDIQRPVKQLQIMGNMSSTSVEHRHTTLILSLREKEMYSHQQKSMVKVHGERDLKVLLEMGQIPFLPEPMRIVIWNCRGLARRSFKTNFMHLCQQNKPDLVVLTETQQV
ncbi:NADH-ubiquinone oxidoreductase chain 1 [Bienertia sinuspersici]